MYLTTLEMWNSLETATIKTPVLCEFALQSQGDEDLAQEIKIIITSSVSNNVHVLHIYAVRVIVVKNNKNHKKETLS